MPASRRLDRRRHGWTFALITAVAAALLSAALVQAENTVSLMIVGNGTLTASLIDGSLGPIQTATTIRQEVGGLSLVVRDPRGTGAGWSVTIESADVTPDGGPLTDRSIVNSRFHVLAAPSPIVLAGQGRVAGGPNGTPLTGASLDTPRQVLHAAPGSGSGDYAQEIRVGLDIPARSQAGAYRTVLTVALSSGP